MADKKELIAPILLDSPLKATYDSEEGILRARSAQPLSDGTQHTIELTLTPHAAHDLYRILQELEQNSPKPPSAWATPRTRQ